MQFYEKDGVPKKMQIFSFILIDLKIGFFYTKIFSGVFKKRDNFILLIKENRTNNRGFQQNGPKQGEKLRKKTIIEKTMIRLIELILP